MLIGRTDDPPSPCRPTANKVADAFGRGSRNPSGPAAVCCTSKAGHTNATALDQIILPNPLALKGPSTHGLRPKGWVIGLTIRNLSRISNVVAVAGENTKAAAIPGSL